MGDGVFFWLLGLTVVLIGVLMRLAVVSGKVGSDIHDRSAHERIGEACTSRNLLGSRIGSLEVRLGNTGLLSGGTVADRLKSLELLYEGISKNGVVSSIGKHSKMLDDLEREGKAIRSEHLMATCLHSDRLLALEQELGYKPDQRQRVTHVHGTVHIGGPGVFGFSDVEKAAKAQGVPVVEPKPTIVERVAALEGKPRKGKK
jgi:hypothetical protein